MLRGGRRRWFGALVTSAVVAAACSSGGDSTSRTSSGTSGGTDADTIVGTIAPPDGPPETAASPDTSPATAPATSPPVSTTTVAPTTTEQPLPPKPVTRQRLVVTGEPDVVFDWTTDRCEDAHIPDIAARAFRDASGRVQLTIGHWNTYRMAGPSLDDVVSDCGTVQMSSGYDPDPAAFDDSEWMGAPYTFDGETVYAVVHNEYRGDTHGSARPGQCPSGQRLPCLDTSFTMAVSTDGGNSFTDIAEPPGHLVATLPYRYIDDSVPSGIRQPSNIIEGPDGFFYLFGNVSDQPDERQWVCAMRTDDLADPGAWRYWDGDGFDGVWLNPYVDEVTADDKCAPLADPALAGSVQESIVFDEALGRYVMVGVGFSPSLSGNDDPGWGFYYATSEDLVTWTTRQLLLDVPTNPSVADPDNETMHAYPALIDPDSTSLNFSTSDGELYLYVSRFNFGGNSLDRDLLRWPIAVEEFEVEPREWTFDDESDLDPGQGGWVTAFDMEPLTVADGALQFTATGPDPHMQTGAVTVPADFGTLTIRMRLPEGGGSSVGQVFWLTDTDGEWDEFKLELFDVTGTGEFVDIELDLGRFDTWDGTITALRIDPWEGSTLEGSIDQIWLSR